MKIVGFLQNCWFPPDTKLSYIQEYLNNDDVRRKVLARSYTGKRLLKAFGEIYYANIIWENVSIEVGLDPNHSGTPNYDHVQAVINKHDPDLVLTFGNVAKETLDYLLLIRKIDHTVLGTKHPSAKDFLDEELMKFSDRVKEISCSSI